MWNHRSRFTEMIASGTVEYLCWHRYPKMELCHLRRSRHIYTHTHTSTTVPYQALSCSYCWHIQDSHVEPVSSSNTRWIQVRSASALHIWVHCIEILRSYIVGMTKVLGACSEVGWYPIGEMASSFEVWVVASCATRHRSSAFRNLQLSSSTGLHCSWLLAM